jgi:peptidoglycan/xylan/chitin deacetylase (PgdA/CDA1 family)
MLGKYVNTLRYRLAEPWLHGYRLSERIRPSPPGAFRILMFHNIRQEQRGAFERLVRFLLDRGGILTPSDVEARLDSRGQEVSKRWNLYLLTFDDGFQGSLGLAKEVLGQYGVKALFFVCPELIDLQQRYGASQIQHATVALPDFAKSQLMSWTDLAELLEMGHTIGSHTALHRRLSLLDHADLKQEIVHSGDELEKQLGTKITWFAYPYGDIASISAPALSIISSRYQFCCSGIRGANTADTPSHALLREEVNLFPPFAYQQLAIEGGLDFAHHQARRRLRLMLQEAMGSVSTAQKVTAAASVPSDTG